MFSSRSSSRSCRKPRRRPVPTRRPALEPLEDRTLPGDTLALLGLSMLDPGLALLYQAELSSELAPGDWAVQTTPITAEAGPALALDTPSDYEWLMWSGAPGGQSDQASPNRAGRQLQENNRAHFLNDLALLDWPDDLLDAGWSLTGGGRSAAFGRSVLAGDALAEGWWQAGAPLTGGQPPAPANSVALLAPATGFFAVSPPTDAGAPVGEAPTPLSDEQKAQLQEAYGRIPLSFEANTGQTDAQVDFLSRGQGYTLFLTSTGAVLSLQKRTEEGNTASVLRMEVVGGNPEAQAAGLNALPGTVSYFRGNDPSQWRSEIATYGKVLYDEVYPGIDLVYYGTNQRQLEYDFVVAPGADPRAIALRFDGADRIEVDAAGDLVLHTAGGQVRQHKPVVYQEAGGTRQEIAGQFVLSNGNQVSFAIAAYDMSRPLVIDPTLSYSTYLGGGLTDEGRGIAVDGNGNAYVTGSSASFDFPITTSAFTGSGTASDAIVTKFNATGTAIVYSAYIGGGNTDVGNAIAVNSSGQAFVTGRTASPDFPLQNALLSYGGAGDAFVLRLSVSGNTLIFSTYLGGGDDDEGNAIAVGASGRAFVAGETSSTNFPTLNAFDQSKGGTRDAFVTVIDTNGPALLYSTYLGGGDFDEALGIARDSSENLYVTGRTVSTNFPTTAPGLFRFAFQQNQPDQDAFVAKLDWHQSGGGSLIYSTYLGGSGIEQASAIAVDSSGRAYVTGRTTSSNFPRKNAFDSTLGGTEDAFVTKLNEFGSNLEWSTFLGGSSVNENGLGIALDSAGNAYVVGFTSSTDFPLANPLQAAHGGLEDAFVTQLTPAGALGFSTYLGGSSFDQANGIAVDANSKVYVVGTTFSTNFPTANAFSGPRGQDDIFVAKLIIVGAGLSGTWQELTQTVAGGSLPFRLRGTFLVQNVGALAAVPSVLRFYLSNNATFDAADVLLQEVTIGALPAGGDRPAHLHALLESSASGKFVLAVVDANDDIEEPNETNNIVAFGPIP